MKSKLPRVTEIMRAAGLYSGMVHIPEIYLEIGRATHKACELLDLCDLDEASLDPTIIGRVEGYRRFLAEMQPEIEAVEQEVTHPVLLYVGHLDRIITIDGRRGVLDIKGPSHDPSTGIQLAAYQHALEPAPAYRWSLHLGDGTYKLIPHTDRDDWPAFRAALTLHQWRKNHA